MEVVSDLEALARVLPYLGADDVLGIGTEDANPSTKAPMAVLYPGTGMGIAGLKPPLKDGSPLQARAGIPASHP